MQPGEWKDYRGKWHGSYYMIGGKMFAHVTQYNNCVPQIVLRLPDTRGFVRWDGPGLHTDMAKAKAIALKRVAVLHPSLFAQTEMEL